MFDVGVRERFETEARSGGRLNHPHVVSVYDWGEEEGISFLVMELLSGRTLADELAEGPLRPQRARRIGVEVLAALDVSHRAGILHRDIKPANVLLAGDGAAKVADFGIAKSVEGADLTATGLVVGTVAYLAPERLVGQPATPQSDLYAVGVVLYEALTGRKPFDAGTPLGVLRAVEQHTPSPLAEACPRLDRGLVAAVERAISKDAGDRFATAAEMADALCTRPAASDHTAAASSTTAFAPTEVLTTPTAERTAAAGVSAATAPAGGRGQRPRRRRRRLIVGVAAAALLAVVLVVAVTRSSSSPGPHFPAVTQAPGPLDPRLPPALDDALKKLESAVRP